MGLRTRVGQVASPRNIATPKIAQKREAARNIETEITRLESELGLAQAAPAAVAPPEGVAPTEPAAPAAPLSIDEQIAQLEQTIGLPAEAAPVAALAAPPEETEPGFFEVEEPLERLRTSLGRTPQERLSLLRASGKFIARLKKGELFFKRKGEKGPLRAFDEEGFTLADIIDFGGDIQEAAVDLLTFGKFRGARPTFARRGVVAGGAATVGSLARTAAIKMAGGEPEALPEAGIAGISSVAGELIVGPIIGRIARGGARIFREITPGVPTRGIRMGEVAAEEDLSRELIRATDDLIEEGVLPRFIPITSRKGEVVDAFFLRADQVLDEDLISPRLRAKIEFFSSEPEMQRFVIEQRKVTQKAIENIIEKIKGPVSKKLRGQELGKLVGNATDNLIREEGSQIGSLRLRAARNAGKQGQDVSRTVERFREIFEDRNIPLDPETGQLLISTDKAGLPRLREALRLDTTKQAKDFADDYALFLQAQQTGVGIDLNTLNVKTALFQKGFSGPEAKGLNKLNRRLYNAIRQDRDDAVLNFLPTEDRRLYSSTVRNFNTSIEAISSLQKLAQNKPALIAEAFIAEGKKNPDIISNAFKALGNEELENNVKGAFLDGLMLKMTDGLTKRVNPLAFKKKLQDLGDDVLDKLFKADEKRQLFSLLDVAERVRKLNARVPRADVEGGAIGAALRLVTKDAFISGRVNAATFFAGLFQGKEKPILDFLSERGFRRTIQGRPPSVAEKTLNFIEDLDSLRTGALVRAVRPTAITPVIRALQEERERPSGAQR